MPPVTITIAIATFNRAELLRQTLIGAVRQEYPTDQYEIIVIDNNSTDHTRNVVLSFSRNHPSPRYVLEPKQGLSAARNRAIREAQGEIIVFADDDILVEPDWLAQLAAPFYDDPECRIGAVGGEVIPVFPSGLPAWMAAWHGPLALRANAGPLAPRQFPMGANLAIRKSIFTHIGGFNENLGRQGTRLMGGEETELLKRLRDHGAEIWFSPEAKVLHQLPASRTTFRYAARHAFDSARSRVIEQKHAPKYFHLSRLVTNTVKLLSYCLLALLSFVAFQGGAAKKSLVRAWRSCGYLYQIPRTLLGKN
jgi:glycosyltransferase involved in cell wall biosynthesis